MNRRFQASIIGGSLLTAAIFAGLVASNYPGIPCIQGQFCLLQGLTILDGGSINTGGAPLATTGPMSICVDPANGNDSLACTVANAGPCVFPSSTACLTPFGAKAKVPKLIRHPVTITLAAGTYDAGMFLEGDTFAYDPTLGGGPFPDAGWIPSLTIQGTLIGASLSSGVDAGVFSAVTQGSAANPNTFGTFSVANGAWDAGNLVGTWVQVTSGADLGDIQPILSNDGGVATIEGNWSATPSAGDGFLIVTPGSIVNDGLTEDSNNAPPTIALGVLNPRFKGAAFIMRELDAPQLQSPAVTLAFLNINPLAGGDGIAVEGDSAQPFLYTDLFTNVLGTSTGSSTRGFFHAVGRGRAMIIGSVFEPSPAIALQAICMHALGVDISGISGWNVSEPMSIYSKHNLFLYGTQNGEAVIYLDRSTFTDDQSTIVSDLDGIRVGDASRVNLAGTHFITNGGAAIHTTPFVDDGAPSFVNIVSPTMVGNGGTTNAIRFDGTGPDIVNWASSGSPTVSGYGVAYLFDNTGGILSGSGGQHIPTPSGSTTADVQFVSLNSGTNFSMGQINTAGQISDGLNEMVQTVENSQYYWLGATLTPAANSSLSLGTVAAPVANIDSITQPKLTAFQGAAPGVETATQVGCDAGVAGAMTVTFSPTFSTANGISCTCSDLNATVHGCGIGATPTTSHVTFEGNSTDMICWSCTGVK